MAEENEQYLEELKNFQPVLEALTKGFKELGLGIEEYKKHTRAADNKFDQLLNKTAVAAAENSKFLLENKREIKNLIVEKSKLIKQEKEEARQKEELSRKVEKYSRTLTEKINITEKRIGSLGKGLGILTAAVGVSSVSFNGFYKILADYGNLIVDLDRSSNIYNQTIKGMDSNFKGIASTLNVSKKEFFEFSSSMRKGFLGVPPAVNGGRDSIMSFAESLRKNFGPAWREVGQELLKIQQTAPLVFDAMRNVQEAMKIGDVSGENAGLKSMMQLAASANLSSRELELLIKATEELTEEQKAELEVQNAQTKAMAQMQEAYLDIAKSFTPLLTGIAKVVEHIGNFIENHTGMAKAIAAIMLIAKMSMASTVASFVIGQKTKIAWWAAETKAIALNTLTKKANAVAGIGGTTKSLAGKFMSSGAAAKGSAVGGAIAAKSMASPIVLAIKGGVAVIGKALAGVVSAIAGLPVLIGAAIIGTGFLAYKAFAPSEQEKRSDKKTAKIDAEVLKELGLVDDSGERTSIARGLDYTQTERAKGSGKSGWGSALLMGTGGLLGIASGINHERKRRQENKDAEEDARRYYTTWTAVLKDREEKEKEVNAQIREQIRNYARAKAELEKSLKVYGDILKIVQTLNKVSQGQLDLQTKFNTLTPDAFERVLRGIRSEMDLVTVQVREIANSITKLGQQDFATSFRVSLEGEDIKEILGEGYDEKRKEVIKVERQRMIEKAMEVDPTLKREDAETEANIRVKSEDFQAKIDSILKSNLAEKLGKKLSASFEDSLGSVEEFHEALENLSSGDLDLAAIGSLQEQAVNLTSLATKEIKELQAKRETASAEEKLSIDANITALQKLLAFYAQAGERLTEQQGNISKVIEMEVRQKGDPTRQQLELLSIQERRLNLEKEVTEAANFGISASLEALQSVLNNLTRQNEMAKQGAQEMQNLIGDKVDELEPGMNKDLKEFIMMSSDIEMIQEALIGKYGEQNEEVNSIIAAKKEELEFSNKELETQKKILDMTKQIREGYLDAISAQAANFGAFTKIIGTQDRNQSQLMRTVRAADGQDALNTMRLGGAVSRTGEERPGGARSNPAMVMTAGGMTSFSREGANREHLWDFEPRQPRDFDPREQAIGAGVLPHAEENVRSEASEQLGGPNIDMKKGQQVESIGDLNQMNAMNFVNHVMNMPPLGKDENAAGFGEELVRTNRVEGSPALPFRTDSSYAGPFNFSSRNPEESDGVAPSPHVRRDASAKKEKVEVVISMDPQIASLFNAQVRTDKTTART